MERHLAVTGIFKGSFIGTLMQIVTEDIQLLISISLTFKYEYVYHCVSSPGQ